MRLISCPSCSQLFRVAEPACPHCRVVLHTIAAPGPTHVASIVLVGLALAGCPAEDGADTQAGTGGSSTTASTTEDATDSVSSTTTVSTTATTTVSTTDTTGTSGMTSTTLGDTSFGEEAAYGVPETESDSFTESSTSESESGTTGTGSDSSGGDSGTTTA